MKLGGKSGGEREAWRVRNGNGFDQNTLYEYIKFLSNKMFKAVYTMHILNNYQLII